MTNGVNQTSEQQNREGNDKFGRFADIFLHQPPGRDDNADSNQINQLVEAAPSLSAETADPTANERPAHY